MDGPPEDIGCEMAARRIVIHAPFGRDASVLHELVEAAGLIPVPADEPEALRRILDGECGVLLVTQEGLGPKTGAMLADVLADQPIWSALPVLALLSDVSRPPPALAALEAGAAGGEVIVLERPCRAVTIRSALRSQSLSRERQHKVRDQLAELAESRTHLRFLLSELDHRSKNLLSKVLSIFSLTRREATDLDNFATAFESRVRALATAHDLLGGGNAAPASITALVERALAAYLGENGQRIQYEGPDLTLWSKGAMTLAMAFYELATNAAKYGALSQPEGRVSLTWRLEGDPAEFFIEWRESGGPRVAEPTRSSFGTDLLRTIAPAELSGDAEMIYAPEGLIWRLRAPYLHGGGETH
ncbi:sensor histidine kinase [Roseicyclus sp. F158]|uniref:histidine kinase n=1 Tax=Tropicimonas omnivorans TaxID=3075590 RepID=A0ABU3DL76_9RHOB|nr:sensor histidine kinase [Roseicyclus sp. F158]MDT0684441.1 sensor histidine kinase [Roseicyclus sp. F158]